ncbi:MAG: 3'-5' exonuclease [Kiritimatiellae bacterium]|nr:3'-5' exonuclease [Kiritimatiellia bacterium]
MSDCSDNASATALRATFTVLDFETTGSVAGWPVEPWQIGMVEVREGRLTGKRFESLLHVERDRPFNPHAPGRHARLRHELAVAPTLGELWTQLTPWLLDRPLVAHNIGTERGLLRRAAPLHRLGPWVDTLRLVRRSHPHLASAALDNAIAHLGLLPRVQAAAPGRAPHDALYDATACALLLLHYLALPGWESVTLQALRDLR